MEVKCLRCGYAWVSRTPDTPPDQCANPKCRTYYWDQPRNTKGHSLEGHQRVALRK